MSSGVFRLISMYTAATRRSTGIFSYWITAQARPTAMDSRMPITPSRRVSQAAFSYRGRYC